MEVWGGGLHTNSEKGKHPGMSNPVLDSCEFVVSAASHVTIDDMAVEAAACSLVIEDVRAMTAPKAFDQGPRLIRLGRDDMHA